MIEARIGSRIEIIDLMVKRCWDSIYDLRVLGNNENV
jgi:hypothetical protein